MTLWAYLQAHDALFALAMLAAVVAVYALSRFLYYDQRARSIQREIDDMNSQAPAALVAVKQRVDPSVGDSDVRSSGTEVLEGAAFPSGSIYGAVRPPDPACGLMALHRAELEQIERRRLRLVVRSSTRGM